MSLLVQKYGGSSLASPRHIREAACRIKKVRECGHQLVVVASAMGRTTDHLIHLAKKTVKRPPQRELDMLMTAGERISMSLLSMALQDLGVPAISFTGSQCGILTTSEHTEARIVEIKGQRIREELERDRVVIVAGFQGVSREREITTLGRGGSDTSAVAIAAALGAEVCEILTDVDGLYTADPRRVPQARLISFCSYDEALELSSLGAKLHSRCVEVARRYGVRIRMGSSRPTEIEGTWILKEIPGGIMETPLIRGIATREGFVYFKATTGFETLLESLLKARVPLRFFQFGENQVRFLCENERADEVREALTKHSVAYEELPKVGIVSAVGDGISSASVLPDFMCVLSEVGAQNLIVCSNSLSLTAAIPVSQLAMVAQKLHERLVVEGK